MSKYTTEVRFICETLAGYEKQEQGYKSVDSILEASAPLVFDFDFPIFDEDYRLGLEKKILKHYYTREIAAETVGLWKLWLDARMNEIMPYYNQLYESALLEFNPLFDTDLTTTYTKEKEGNTTDTEAQTTTNTSETNTTVNYDEETTDKTVTEGDGTTTTQTETSNTHYDLYSDTPQGALNGVESQEYLTNARKVTDDGTSKGTETVHSEVTEDGSGTKDSTTTTNSITESSGTKNTDGSGTSNSTEVFTQNVVGKSQQVSYSKFLQEYRETFLNIDMMVINDLKDLFFNLW